MKVYAWRLRQDYINPDDIVETGYTICWAAKWLGRAEVMFGSVHRHGATKMVKSVHKLLDEADAVAHFNGEKFDIPTLNKEFLLHGLTPPSPFKHIDLLKTCRERFAFASNKLDHVSQVLGIGAKIHHKGMELWRGCMAGDDASWRVMESYNKGDVRLTEKLYERLLPWIRNHPNVGVYDGVDEHDRKCPTCASTKLQRRGDYIASAMRYARYQCKGCGKWSRGRKPIQGPPQGALIAA